MVCEHFGVEHTDLVGFSADGRSEQPRATGSGSAGGGAVQSEDLAFHVDRRLSPVHIEPAGATPSDRSSLFLLGS